MKGQNVAGDFHVASIVKLLHPQLIKYFQEITKFHSHPVNDTLVNKQKVKVGLNANRNKQM